MEAVIASAITTYHELNPSVIDELDEEPSALEFMRYVARNRPFVVRNAASEWPALRKWDAEYLREAMQEESVKVAITPFGNADAVVESSHGPLWFVEPYEVFELFPSFLDYIQEDSKRRPSDAERRLVKYAQTQNDNLRQEYSNLFQDVPSEVAFARLALEKEADAINLWIGNERSVTSLHKDNYENIYVQVRGQKHFVLLAPIEMPCTNEQLLPSARYRPVGDSIPKSPEDLTFDVNDCENLLPIPTWDPDELLTRPSRWADLSKPLRVTLEEGDLLYLPAMWYHKVSQSSGDEGFACAVNYWYDMEFSGGFWTTNSFLRDVSNIQKTKKCSAEREEVD